MSVREGAYEVNGISYAWEAITIIILLHIGTYAAVGASNCYKTCADAECVSLK